MPSKNNKNTAKNLIEPIRKIKEFIEQHGDKTYLQLLDDLLKPTSSTQDKIITIFKLLSEQPNYRLACQISTEFTTSLFLNFSVPNFPEKIPSLLYWFSLYLNAMSQRTYFSDKVINKFLDLINEFNTNRLKNTTYDFSLYAEIIEAMNRFFSLCNRLGNMTLETSFKHQMIYFKLIENLFNTFLMRDHCDFEHRHFLLHTCTIVDANFANNRDSFNPEQINRFLWLSQQVKEKMTKPIINSDTLKGAFLGPPPNTSQLQSLAADHLPIPTYV